MKNKENIISQNDRIGRPREYHLELELTIGNIRKERDRLLCEADAISSSIQVKERGVLNLEK